MILMLKAQTNHFAHLDIDLRNEMITLRQDMGKRFEQMQQETAKRFEQVDRRFEQLTSRLDHFMIWSFATTVSVGGWSWHQLSMCKAKTGIQPVLSVCESGVKKSTSQMRVLRNTCD